MANELILLFISCLLTIFFFFDALATTVNLKSNS